MSSRRRRLDLLLVERGLAPSRTQAQARILAGEVMVDDHRIDKPGTLVAADAELRLRQGRTRFASRAGDKLDFALTHFAIDVAGTTALDAGASTGGFVDVLLRRGARRVYAIDVGYGQLDLALRQDPRVVVLDRVNVRHLEPSQVPEPVQLFTLDLSFISLTKVLEPLLPFAAPAARWVCLVKPQFEVGRARVGKGGIVRDPAARRDAVVQVRSCAEALGLEALGDVESPLPGQKGNIERLLLLRGSGRLTA